MKPSREQQLSSQGLLPLLPQPAGRRARVAFVPLDLARPLTGQGRIDVLLHKASDELVEAPGDGLADGSGGSGEGAVGGGDDGSGVDDAQAPNASGSRAPAWSPALQRLQQQLRRRPEICVVDPFECTAKARCWNALDCCQAGLCVGCLGGGPGALGAASPFETAGTHLQCTHVSCIRHAFPSHPPCIPFAPQVVDRAELCRVLEGLGGLLLPGRLRARAPKHLVVESLGAHDLRRRLDEAGASVWVYACVIRGERLEGRRLDEG